MKKLLSILAITSSISTVSNSVISCETATHKKIDFPKDYKFPNVPNNQLVWDWVYLHIALNVKDAEGNRIYDQIDDVKNDKDLVIQILDPILKRTIPQSVKSPILSPYLLYITVNVGDQYLNPMPRTYFDLNAVE